MSKPFTYSQTTEVVGGAQATDSVLPLWRVLAATITVLVLAFGALAFAQPYAASGGFARPTLDDASATTASVAVTVSPTNVITTVWGGAEGVWQQDKSAGGTTQASLLIPTNDVRTVSAAYIGSDLLVTWVSRNRSTGTYHYYLFFQGQQQELFTEALIIPLHLFEISGRPFAAGLFRGGGQGQVRVLDLLETTPQSSQNVVYTSDLTLRGLDVLTQADGGIWLGWLEGKNESSEFGLISEWDAFVGYLPGINGAMVGPVGLGEAYVEDERLRVALTAQPGTETGPTAELVGFERAVHTLWADEDANLRITQVVLAANSLSISPDEQVIGTGRPVGAAWPYVYWVSGSSIVGANVLQPQPSNVIWSPITIEGSGFAAYVPDCSAVSAGAACPPALTAMAWYGRAQGGAIQVYSTDTRTPLNLSFADRLAALMGWSPWHVWDELIGQVLTALLIGMLAGIALVPILIVVGSLIARFLTPVRAQILGVATGVLLLAGGAAVYQIGFPSPDERRLIWLALLASGVLGTVVGWLVSRTGDREAQATFTVAGSTTVFVAATVWAFITYMQWSALVGLR